MRRPRDRAARALRSAALLLPLLVLAGCGPSPAPADSAPPAPSTTGDAPTPTPVPTETPTPSAVPTSPATATPAPPVVTASPEWQRFEAPDGRTSWRMPPGWTADITTEVVEGNPAWTDHRGLVRDDAGTPMLRFEAVASGGQYASDSTPCTRPATEVLDAAPMGGAVASAGAARVAVAYEGSSGVIFAAGISQNDPHAACGPGIIALYDAGYDYLVFEIVDDAGLAAPVFGSFDAARAYAETDEYRAIRDVLDSFEVVARS